jgi:hypothetical protein
MLLNDFEPRHEYSGKQIVQQVPTYNCLQVLPSCTCTRNRYLRESLPKRQRQRQPHPLAPAKTKETKHKTLVSCPDFSDALRSPPRCPTPAPISCARVTLARLDCRAWFCFVSLARHVEWSEWRVTEGDAHASRWQKRLTRAAARCRLMFHWSLVVLFAVQGSLFLFRREADLRGPFEGLLV